MPRVFRFSIPDAMCYETCGQSIRRTLGDSLKISQDDIEFNLAARSLVIKIPDEIVISDSAIKQVLDDTGFHSYTSKAKSTSLWKGVTGTAFGLLLMLLGAWGIAIPWLFTLSLGAAFYLGLDTYIQASRTKKLTVDTLFTLSTLTMICVSLVGLLFPSLGIKLMCDMALLTLGIKYLGTALQQYVKGEPAVNPSLLDRIPAEHLATLENGKKIAFKDLKIGDVIKLSPGQYLPVNVKCLKQCAVTHVLGDGQINQAKIYTEDTQLYQGMCLAVAGSESQLFKVTQTYEDSYCSKSYAQLKDLHDQGLTSYLNSFLRYFVVAVIVTAVITGLVMAVWGFQWQLIMNAVMCVFTAACPCSLGVNHGLATKAVKKQMQQESIDCPNVKLLQRPLTDIVFDFNGTLLEPTPSEIKVVGLRGDNAGDLAQLIYRLEKDQRHPYARAICERLILDNNSLVRQFKDERLERDFSHHSGISATVDGKAIGVGNENMFEGKKEQFKRLIRENEGEDAFACHQYIYIVENGELIGYVKLGVKLRPDAKKIISHFQQKKMQVHICTGADEATVSAYLEQAGISGVTVKGNCAALLGADEKESTKVKYTQDLQSQGKSVIGVGDGGNDVPFLLQCDMGVAILSPAADAMTQAVSQLSIKSLSDLPTGLPKVQHILSAGAQLKEANDMLSCFLNCVCMFMPMFLMGLCGVVCPPFLGPLLMWVPLLGASMHTVYKMREKPVLKPETSVSYSSTTSGLLLSKGLGYISPHLFYRETASMCEGQSIYNVFDTNVRLPIRSNLSERQASASPATTRITV